MTDREQLKEIDSELGNAKLTESTATPERAPSPDDAAPGWFRRQRKRKSDTQAAPKKRAREPALPRIQVDPQEPESMTHLQSFAAWVRSDEARGVYSSVAIHAAVLLALLSLVLPSKDLNDIGGINATMSDDDGIGEAELFTEELTEVEVEVQQTDKPKPQVIPVQSILGTTAVAEPFEPKFEFRMPAGGNAVTKGSFTAWTKPEDPQPGSPYWIVIQIQLPPHLKRYPVEDLSGKVVGTDKFNQILPVDPRPGMGGRLQSTRNGRIVSLNLQSRLPVVDEKVRMMIFIPGAAELVKDTIQIRSKLLNESQTLDIVF